MASVPWAVGSPVVNTVSPVLGRDSNKRKSDSQLVKGSPKLPHIDPSLIEEPDILQILPPECVQHILSYVGFKYLPKVFLVCQAFFSLATDPILLKQVRLQFLKDEIFRMMDEQKVSDENMLQIVGIFLSLNDMDSAIRAKNAIADDEMAKTFAVIEMAKTMVLKNPDISPVKLLEELQVNPDNFLSRDEYIGLGIEDSFEEALDGCFEALKCYHKVSALTELAAKCDEKFVSEVLAEAIKLVDLFPVERTQRVLRYLVYGVQRTRDPMQAGETFEKLSERFKNKAAEKKLYEDSQRDCQKAIEDAKQKWSNKQRLLPVLMRIALANAQNHNDSAFIAIDAANDLLRSDRDLAEKNAKFVHKRALMVRAYFDAKQIAAEAHEIASHREKLRVLFLIAKVVEKSNPTEAIECLRSAYKANQEWDPMIKKEQKVKKHWERKLLAKLTKMKDFETLQSFLKECSLQERKLHISSRLVTDIVEELPAQIEDALESQFVSVLDDENAEDEEIYNTNIALRPLEVLDDVQTIDESAVKSRILLRVIDALYHKGFLQCFQIALTIPDESSRALAFARVLKA